MEARAGSEGAVNGRRWRWCRNIQERQLRASAVVRARLGAAQSGLGRVGSTGWCRRGLWLRLGSGNGAGRGSSGGSSAGGSGGSLWEGEYEVTKWPTPSPLFIGLMRQPKSPLPPFFAIIANLGFSLHHHLYFKFFSLNINKIRNENYYNKN